jgi:O-acetylhomoserine (thiol)-lyase
MNPNWKIDTIAVQGGYEPKSGEPRILPIIQRRFIVYTHVSKSATTSVLERDKIDKPGKTK